jgi:dihydroorotase
MERNQDSSGRDTREQGLFELVLKGGRVIDPARKFDQLADVAFAQGRVAAVEPDITAS